MSELSGQVGELRMTIEIKRAATGKTDIVELVAIMTEEEAKEEETE